MKAFYLALIALFMFMVLYGIYAQSKGYSKLLMQRIEQLTEEQ